MNFAENLLHYASQQGKKTALITAGKTIHPLFGRLIVCVCVCRRGADPSADIILSAERGCGCNCFRSLGTGGGQRRRSGRSESKLIFLHQSLSLSLSLRLSPELISGSRSNVGCSQSGCNMDLNLS